MTLNLLKLTLKSASNMLHIHRIILYNLQLKIAVHLDYIKELEELQDLINELVLPNNQEKETEELDSDSLPPITHNKAVELYDKVILYLEQ
ncbi:hypothetical protein RhiirA5_435139 [Rhizophagus irregularis]|uniref:Uncharacterized protein n=1 Tax=Rhizophagus irregularis TaxID=588596 RepID=A0A2N0NNV9_9GLOM|nr:hypothetical protein RhiirA5_435139 [Rhizophagus irregularis]GET50658.1 hypothetical protein RIR_jg21758.t1 [Rhizophagus irregularis DAOM 181602=DAOM 197198]